MNQLFSPLSLRSLEIKNRLVISPMCQYSSVDGFANDWHLVHLGARAVGGAGLVFTEATSVTEAGRITHSDLGIWKEEHLEMLGRIARFIKAQGSIAGMQLAHAGRKASHHVPWNGGKALTASEDAWETQAPSALPFLDGDLAPKAMSQEDIREVTRAFQTAAIRALKAGFQILEIHAAHGYLIHEFLSPLTNKRTDEYGGNFENRTRFLLEVYKAIREVVPEELPVFVRISATDWVEEGWTLEDSIALAKLLKGLGADLIDCSSGGIIPNVKIPVAPLYQLHFAEAIKKETGIPTGAVGLITTTAQAEAIIKEGKADLVFLARQVLRDPHFPLRAAAQLEEDIPWPVQYDRAKTHFEV
jgi:2,4-dienoyl-CoA reductase-like NADH-dependent reductase (Old Yellow Enzyme family)